MFLVVAFYLAGPSFFYFTNMMKNSFIERSFKTTHEMEINYYEITTIDDFWMYMKNIFNRVSTKNWNPRSDIDPDDDDDGDDDDEDDTKMMKYQTKFTPFNHKFDAIFTENILLNTPRLRQLRVRNNSCVVHKLFQKAFSECYGHFASENEDRNTLKKDKMIWEYNEPNYKTDEWFNWGLVAVYPGGGYIEIMDCLDNCVQKIKELKTIGWIDRGTRVIFIEFTIYNGNVNIFCVVKYDFFYFYFFFYLLQFFLIHRLMAEIPPSGGVVPSFSIRTVKLLRFINNWDYVILACEIILALQVIYYIIEEIFELCHEGYKYFFSFWNWIDLSIILVRKSRKFGFLKNILLIYFRFRLRLQL